MIHKLKSDEIEKLCENLSEKKIILTLSKYIFEAFELIHDQDEAFKAVCPNLNGQTLLKVQCALKKSCGNSCILKAQFDRNEIL